MAKGGKLGQIGTITVAVGDPGERHDAGAVVDKRTIALERDAALLVRFGKTRFHPSGLKIAPGEGVVLVFDFADDHVVTFSPRESLGDDADALGGVFDK